MPLLDIAWLNPDGSGGGRDDEGRAVRVAGALPGDRVRHARGVLEELVVPSPHRRAPTCPWDAGCGGCDLAALAPDARHEALARLVQRAFGAEAAPPLVPSPRATAHRARIKLAIYGGRVGYRGARSHDLVEPGTCAIAREELQAALQRLREVESLDGLASVELRSDGARAVYAFQSGGPVPRATRDAIAGLGDVALDGRKLAGDPVLWLDVLGSRLRASPRAFFQVNLEANALLAAHVRDEVLRMRSERVLDLYSGIGNLGVPIAARGVPVVAVEREGQATEDLKASAAGLPVHAVTLPVERFDPSREAFDVVVLDPPRAGAPGVLERLLRNRPRGIVYVSCNPVAAAKELKVAQKAGYRMTSLRCYDLFPDTRHVEAVVVFER